MKMKKLLLTAPALCLALAFGSSCSNNSPSQDSTEHAEQMNEENLTREGEKDADRLIDLYAVNLYEVKASEAAVQRASTDDVKKIASMMIQAHTKMTTEIQQLASNKGITLPGEINNNLMRDMDKLNEKTGLDYDKEYLDDMKKKHEDALDKLQNTSDKAEDTDIKALASKAIPEIRSHLDMVEVSRNKIKDMKDNTRKASKGNSTAGADPND